MPGKGAIIINKQYGAHAAHYSCQANLNPETRRFSSSATLSRSRTALLVPRAVLAVSSSVIEAF